MKDYLRDYCTEAFRFYACNGMSADKYKQKIYDEALEQQKRLEGKSGIGSPTEAAIIRAEAAVDEKLAEIKDMEAVEMTLAELHARAMPYIVQAIKIVYFNDAGKELEPGDISLRVHAAELDIPASESSIYRYLRKARILFAEHRGLRIEKNKKEEIFEKLTVNRV